ncbi:MAG: helicase, partial [bacterium]|nr:helicase [bacterium]
PLPGESAARYARRQAEVWGVAPDPGEGLAEADELKIGAWLKTTKLFGHLLRIFAESEKDREGPLTWERLIRELTTAEPELSAYAHEEPQRDRRSEIVFSLLALVAHARELRSGEVQPLVPTQVQLWVRELRRLGRVVGEDPAFTWLDEPVESAPSLPAVHCNECGESGWIAVHNPAKDSLVQSKGGILQLKKAPEEIYREWFATGDRRPRHGQYVVVIVPLRTGDDEPEPGEQRRLATEDLYLYPQSLVIGRDPNACPLTQDARSIRVRISNETEPGRT